MFLTSSVGQRLVAVEVMTAVEVVMLQEEVVVAQVVSSSIVGAVAVTLGVSTSSNSCYTSIDSDNCSHTKPLL